MKKSKNRKFIFILVVAILIVISSVGSFYAVKQYQQAKTYLQAENYFDQKEYSAAKKLFTQLGPYRDSAEWVSKCEIQPELDSAADLMNQCQYEQARAIYQKYKLDENSRECTYQLAISYADAEEYAKSLQEFEQIPDYKDVPAKTQSCAYKYAGYLFNKEKYEDAKILFESTGDYKNSKNFVEKCRLANKYSTFDVNDSYLGGIDPDSSSSIEIYESMEEWFDADFYGTWYSETGDTLKIDKYKINDVPYQITGSIINSHPEFYYKYENDETIHHFSFSSATDPVKGNVKQIIFDDYTWYYSVGGQELKELLKQWDIIAEENKKEAEMFRESLHEENIKNDLKSETIEKFKEWYKNGDMYRFPFYIYGLLE